jgi:dipeptidyl aminopeptidase/acylaminoacyl peptidase
MEALRPFATRTWIWFFCLIAAPLTAQTRSMEPADLFRVQRVGAVAWSADSRRAAVEITHPGRWIGSAIPTAEIDVVDAQAATMRRIASPAAPFMGFFAGTWSPDGRCLAFLSVDTNAIVRPWIWSVGQRQPVMLRRVQIHDGPADGPALAWSDAFHIVLLARDSTRPNAGPLSVAILRDRNVADAWQRARDGTRAAVSVVDTHASGDAASTSSLVSIDVRNGATTTLAKGRLHHVVLSTDRRTLTYRRNADDDTVVSRYFAPTGDVDAAYLAVNWGHEEHYVDPHSGAPTPAPAPPTPATRDTAAASLRITSSLTDGTRLDLLRRGHADTTMWRGNLWVRSVRTGHARAITYTALDGKVLTAWLLLPAADSMGSLAHRLPVVTIIYPGTTYSERTPLDLSVFHDDFEHPQLFAALGYAVLLPSMPVDPQRQASSINDLAAGVLPVVDTLIARGIADSNRIALLGQSAGGYATLGLISQTDQFRSAIASGAYVDLASAYGTFYGEFRYGDAGSATQAQLLRMLQFERGVFGAPGAPWEVPDWYRSASPITYVARVHTPVMLIKGDADFVPTQQAEEYFTALYRQGKRAAFVRYAGEGHTIAARANVLDMWSRIDRWLRETMPP